VNLHLVTSQDASKNVGPPFHRIRTNMSLKPVQKAFVQLHFSSYMLCSEHIDQPSTTAISRSSHSSPSSPCSPSSPSSPILLSSTIIHLPSINASSRGSFLQVPPLPTPLTFPTLHAPCIRNHIIGRYLGVLHDDLLASFAPSLIAPSIVVLPCSENTIP